MGQYGSLKTALGHADQALPILEEAERMAVKFTAPASALHLLNRIYLAEAHQALGQQQRAAEIAIETLAMARKQFGPDHIYALRVRLSTTKLLAYRQSPAQTLADLAEIATKLRAQGAAAQPPLTQTLIAQGDLLTQQQRAREALPLLEEAVRIRQQTMWEKSWELAEARARLGEAQLAIGNPQGKQLIEQSAAILQSQLGPNHPQTLRARRAM
jgi:eukaryotic-like serine/threonine-protein kinase